MSIRQRVDRWISSPRAPWIAAFLAVALSLPSLMAGFAADDHAMALGLTEGDLPAWDVFDVGRYGSVPVWRERGYMGWWAADDLRIAFLRPISSLTHWVDFRL